MCAMDERKTDETDRQGKSPEKEPVKKEKNVAMKDVRRTERTKNCIADINLMLEYCLNKGIPISNETQEKLPWFYSVEDAMINSEGLAKLVNIHGLLCRIIEPATPRSLAATKFSLGKGSWKTTVFILLLIIAAIVGLLGYLYTLGTWGFDTPTTLHWPSDTPKTEYSRAMLTASLLPVPMMAKLGAKLRKNNDQGFTARESLNYLFAALIGSAFYGLLKAYGYLRKRTFDPDYILTYVIRLFLGIISGIILAMFGSELLKGTDTFSRLGPGILALLGGYSAEAVRQVLDRAVEVSITVVQGRDSFNEQRLAVSKDVLSIAQAAAKDAETPQHLREKLDALMKKLQQ